MLKRMHVWKAYLAICCKEQTDCMSPKSPYPELMEFQQLASMALTCNPQRFNDLVVYIEYHDGSPVDVRLQLRVCLHCTNAFGARSRALENECKPLYQLPILSKHSYHYKNNLFSLSCFSDTSSHWSYFTLALNPNIARPKHVQSFRPRAMPGADCERRYI